MPPRRAALPDGLPFHRPEALAATWFGTGLLPLMPGTWGAMAAVPVAWVVALRAGPWAVLFCGILLFLVGLWAVAGYLRHAREEDPPAVVIDEVAGQTIALAPAGLDPVAVALGFCLFRIFDIMKPWPLRALERLKGPVGVMADDAAAGLAAGGLVMLYFYFIQRDNALF